jgi:hypothetical protein
MYKILAIINNIIKYYMKKIIIIWANCQGNPIKYMLNKYCNDVFDIHCFLNYTYIKDNKPLPEIFYKCDIFLYQNYSNNDEKYDLKNIIENKLKKECIKICFPSLHSCSLLFCYDVCSPNNYKTITKEKPHGEFFFGISCIDEIIKNRFQYKINWEKLSRNKAAVPYLLKNINKI